MKTRFVGTDGCPEGEVFFSFLIWADLPEGLLCYLSSLFLQAHSSRADAGLVVCLAPGLSNLALQAVRPEEAGGARRLCVSWVTCLSLV